MIFSFSGTGNSYAVGRRVADELGLGMVDLAAAVRYGRYSYDARGEDVGFVFPVYFGGLPSMVREFASGVTVANPGRVFCIATCGGDSGGAPELLSEALGGRLRLDACYDVLMPDRAIFASEPPSPEEEARILEESEAEVAGIVGSLRAGESGDLRTHAGGTDWRSVHQMYDGFRSTEPFAVTEACIECRVCEDICPEQAIKVYHRKPVWDEERCSLCMGCLQICPKQAIEYGESTRGRRRSYNRSFYERSLGLKLRY